MAAVKDLQSIMDSEKKEVSTRSKTAGATAKATASNVSNVDVDNLVQAISRSFESMQSEKPKYSPKVPRNYGVGQDFQTWLAQFNHFCKLASIQESHKRDVMLSLLEQSAYKAVSLLKLDESMQFDEFVAKLVERFEAGRTTGDYKLQLKVRNQSKNESEDDYADVLLEMTDKAYPNASQDFRDELARDRFIEGVNVADEIREKLFVNQPKSLQDAVRMTRSLQSARKAASHNMKAAQQKKLSCDVISAGYGSETKSEIKELKELVKSLKIKIENLEGKIERKSNKKLDEVRCFVCQKLGHYASTCPSKKSLENEEKRLTRGSQPQ